MRVHGHVVPPEGEEEHAGRGLAAHARAGRTDRRAPRAAAHWRARPGHHRPSGARRLRWRGGCSRSAPPWWGRGRPAVWRPPPRPPAPRARPPTRRSARAGAVATSRLRSLVFCESTVSTSSSTGRVVRAQRAGGRTPSAGGPGWRAAGGGRVASALAEGYAPRSASLQAVVLRAALSAVTAPPRGRSAEVAPGTRRFPRPGRIADHAGRGGAASTGGASPCARSRCGRGRLPDLEPRTVDLAAHTFRAELFGARGLHDLERPVVRRPPHARLQRAVAAAGLAARPTGGAGAGRAGLAPRCSSRLCAALRGRARALGRDLVRRRHRHAPVHRPPAVRARRGVRAGGAAALQRRRYSLALVLRRACARSAARWPGCSWRWRASPTRSPSAGGHASGARASRRGRRAHPAGLPRVAFPEGG